MFYRFSLTRVVGQEVEACVRINHHSFRKNKAAAFPLLLFSMSPKARKQTNHCQTTTDRPKHEAYHYSDRSIPFLLLVSLIVSQPEAGRP